jgi:HEAT repeats
MSRLVMAVGVILFVPIGLFAQEPSPLTDPTKGGKPLANWITDLASPEHATRLTAVRVIAVLGPKAAEASDALLAVNEYGIGLTPLPLRAAFAAIGPEPVAKYFAGLTDANPNRIVRSNARAALVAIKPDAAAVEKGLLAAFDALPKAGDMAAYDVVACVEQLLKKPSEAVAAKLKPLLSHKDQSLAAAAARAMAVADPTDADAVRVLLTPIQSNPFVKEANHFAVAKFGAAAVPVIVEKMAQPNGRFDASVALLLPKDAASSVAVPKLTAIAVGTNAAESGPARFVLQELGPVAKGAIPELTKAFRSPRMDAMQFLAPLLAVGAEPKELAAQAVELFKDVPDTFKNGHLATLRKLGPDAREAVLEYIKPRLNDRKHHYAQPLMIETMLGYDPKSAALIPDLMKNPEHLLFGSQYAYVLDKLPREELLAALRAETKAGDLKKRIQMAALVLRFAPKDAEAATLLKEHVLDDAVVPAPPGVPPRKFVRHAPLAAFEAAGEDGVSHLAVLAAHAEPNVRSNVLPILGRIGPKAKAAGGAVRNQLADPDWTIRYAAARALFRIDPADKAAVPVLAELFLPENRKVLLNSLRPARTVSQLKGYNEPPAVTASREAADLYFDLDPVAAVKANVYGIVLPKTQPAPPRDKK